jgi:hypothetical protein
LWKAFLIYFNIFNLFKAIEQASFPRKRLFPHLRGTMTISPSQVRAARAFLKIGLKEIAARSQVTAVAISNYENNRVMRQNRATNAAVERAFAELGIEFETGDDFELVRLRKK